MNLYKNLIFCYILVGLVPYFDTADKIHPQTLYLALLNIISLGLIIYKGGIRQTISTLLKSISYKPAIFYFLFICFSVISVFQSVNIIQSLISLSEIFIMCLAFMILIFLLSNIENLKKFFFQLVIFLTSIELLATFYPYLKDIYDYGSPNYRALKYRGFTGSINIVCFLLLIKLPFLYYFSIKFKKYRWAYILLSTLSMYTIMSIFLTRSAIIALILVTSFLLVVFFYNYSTNKKTNYYNPKRILLAVAFPILLNLLINNVLPSPYDAGLDKYVSSSVQDRLSTLDIEEYSTNSRFRYWKAAIQSIIKNPLTGIGVGNWQLVSIDYDRSAMGNYVVPYHAHNDFLEISAESGLQAGIFYYLTILFAVFFLLKKIINSIKKKEPLEYDLILMTALLMYLFDSMINFPYGRPLQQVTILFLVAYFVNLYKIKPLKLKPNLKKSILVLISLSIPFVLYSSSRMFLSSQDQRTLLYHYNLADFTLPLEQIDEMDMHYSDLTVTTLPMLSMKGFFYMRDGRFREAIEFSQEGTKSNPYLYYSEANIAYSYYNLGQLDSAEYYGELAFNKLPGNVVHFANYAVTLAALKDTLGLKAAYEKGKRKDEMWDQVYLATMADILDEDDSNLVLEDFSFNVQSGTDAMKKSYYTLKLGRDDMFDAAKLNELGDFLFSKQNYAEAAVAFGEAVTLNPFELPYQENYANAHLQLGNFSEAVEILENLIYQNESESRKAKYMLVLAYLNMDDTIKACPLIEELMEYPEFDYSNLGRFCN